MEVRYMKKSDLQPTHENLLKCLEEDSIGRNKELLYFIKLLNSISGAYTIALDGRWGSGKTFFVKQAKMLFDAFNEYTQMEHGISDDDRQSIKNTWNLMFLSSQKTKFLPLSHVCVYFDAWEHDLDEDPIASLLYSISATASCEYRFDGERNYIDTAVDIIDLLSGKDHKSLFNSLKSKSIIDTVSGRIDIQNKVNEYLDNLLPEHGDRLLVFIDELDRCNPCYAVKLLEKIKHYFVNEKITFVFSVNLEQLQYTIRQHYGEGFNAYKYLDRFFDFMLPMPKLNLDKYYENIGVDLYNAIYQVANVVIKKYELEMREVSKFFSSLRVVTQKRLNSGPSSNGKDICFCFILPIALGLQKHNLTHYDDFIHGRSIEPLIEIMSSDEFLDISVRFLFKNSEIPDVNVPEEIKLRIRKLYTLLTNSNTSKDSVIGNTTIDINTISYFNKILGMLCDSSTFDD